MSTPSLKKSVSLPPPPPDVPHKNATPYRLPPLPEGTFPPRPFSLPSISESPPPVSLQHLNLHNLAALLTLQKNENLQTCGKNLQKYQQTLDPSKKIEIKELQSIIATIQETIQDESIPDEIKRQFKNSSMI